jgi:hypothetical protein
MRPPQYAAHTGQHLAQMEGLRNIVVSTKLKADNTVDHVAFARHHDDRHTRFGAYAAGDFEPILIAKRKIEGDEVDRLGLDERKERRTTRGLAHPETLRLERAAQNCPDPRVIVDDDDVGSSHHSGPLAHDTNCHNLTPARQREAMEAWFLRDR